MILRKSKIDVFDAELLVNIDQIDIERFRRNIISCRTLGYNNIKVVFQGFVSFDEYREILNDWKINYLVNFSRCNQLNRYPGDGLMSSCFSLNLVQKGYWV